MDIIEIKTAGMLATSFTVNGTEELGASDSFAPELGPGMESPADLLGLPDYVFK